MRHVTRQLEKVRRMARFMLMAQPVLQLIAALAVVALACGGVDYLLRLPGGLRLGIGLMVLVAAGVWLVRRLALAVGFNPQFSTLALRAEQMYPQLAGLLASGVDFALHPKDYDDPPRTRALANASIENARRSVRGVSLGKLINPTRAVAHLLLALVLMGTVTSVAVALPEHSAIAARRWFNPLGGAQWPRRTLIESLVQPSIWPADMPISLQARVGRGYTSGMRAWVHYRIVNAGGAQGKWQALLMSEQAGTTASAEEGMDVGRFERLIDVPGALTGLGRASANAENQLPSIQFYFQAGDHQTETQFMPLVTRPALDQLLLETRPPRYARGLVSERQITLHQGGRRPGQMTTATALEGSSIRLELQLNKPIPPENARLETLLPGLAQVPDATVDLSALKAPGAEIVAKFPLRQTVQTAIQLIDEHGLSSLSERQYRIEAEADKPPTVTLLEPRGDESVLPTARVAIHAVARDDIGVESLAIEVQVPEGRVGVGDDRQSTAQMLHQVTGRRARLEGEHQLDLALLPVNPGDVVLLWGVAQDVFDMDGQRHDPVRSTPRRLRVIDSAQFIAQVRSELAGVRQHALRLQKEQRDIASKPAKTARPRQQQMTKRLATQTAVLETLGERIERNRLDAEESGQLGDVVRRAGKLVREASEASAVASEKLQQVQKQPSKGKQESEQAHLQQTRVTRALTDLIAMLDQGRQVATLRLKLQQLKADQEQVARATGEALPRTLGKRPEELSAQEKQTQAALANRQASLARRAGALAQRMRAVAQSLDRPHAGADDQAAAQALSEAASIAQRQGLAQTMGDSAQAIKQNRLSAARGSQEQSDRTMQQMLERMNEQAQRRRAILQRQLASLSQAITKLIEQQRAQHDRLKKAVMLGGLDAPMVTLNRNTLAVGDEVQQLGKVPQAAQHLAAAADSQAEAIIALRADEREQAGAAESGALEHLIAARAALDQARQAARDQQTRTRRAQLKARYQQLAKQQDELRQGTSLFVDVEKMTRPQRRDLVALGHREAELQAQAQDLSAEVENTLIFQHIHMRIDRLALQVATELRSARADLGVMRGQAKIALLLRQMAGALGEDPSPPEPFVGGSDDPEGGGGGGGSGQAQARLVPPGAELRLLRELQQVLYQSTAHTHRQNDLTQAARKQLLLELSGEQRELASLGEKLVRQAMRSRSPMVKPKRSQ